MPQYSIEARSLGVVGVAGHNFWVLRDENERALAELHGLATNRETGRPFAIGVNSDWYSLRVWELANDAKYAEARGVDVANTTYIGTDQPSKTVLTADSDEVMARWNAAAKAKEPLNALNLDYPTLGVNVFKDTVNSNSTYRTLGEIMGVSVPEFPGRMQPGIDSRMVSPEVIEKLRTHGYPALNEPTIQRPEQHGAISRDDGLSSFLDRMMVATQSGDDAAFRQMTQALANMPQGQALRTEAIATVNRQEQQMATQHAELQQAAQQKIQAAPVMRI